MEPGGNANVVRLADVSGQQRNNTNSNRAPTSGSGENGSQHYSHMTLDGRRRPRNAPQSHGAQSPTTTNEADHWNDWTSTWRRVGAKGQSQAVTMTGTVTRGKKKGQVVDVQLDLTDRELMEISAIHDRRQPSTPQTPDSMPSSGFEPKTSECGCGIESGPHIFLLSVLAFPFIFVASLFVSFYFGALTWQNIFSHFYDERTICHRIFICPFLVILFPLFIIIFTFGIAIYAAFIQLRWSFLKWKDEVGSLEKGFYGWLCGKLGLEDCSPYTVIELFGSGDSEQQAQNANSSDGRVTVLYVEQNDRQRRPQNSSQNNRSSLPSSSSRHTRMQRMESAM